MFNKVFLIGNLTRDPELRYTPAGLAVAHFTLAVNRRAPKDSKETGVDFINCVAWRRLAEICGEYLKKGKSTAVEGKLQIRSYEKNGQKRTISEVIVDNMQMLGRKDETTAHPAAVEEAVGSPAPPEEAEEEIPF